jgi:hypothetical protein
MAWRSYRRRAQSTQIEVLAPPDGLRGSVSKRHDPLDWYAAMECLGDGSAAPAAGRAALSDQAPPAVAGYESAAQFAAAMAVTATTHLDLLMVSPE